MLSERLPGCSVNVMTTRSRVWLAVAGGSSAFSQGSREAGSWLGLLHIPDQPQPDRQRQLQTKKQTNEQTS
ncbi:hypothetical protein PGTUg99_023873 [Puccinia graminis f. sp. tritici]|uniref:Uncharacterized protein n=1 Tax=Puccinia graminis f. sp. tritici TaxID=56615 RepID=A0A5B0RGP7_PUCGR|nr:hypothetical protein PGTUg99_023873 [Puccinia graminis f. sp. tritici]